MFNMSHSLQHNYLYPCHYLIIVSPKIVEFLQYILLLSSVVGTLKYNFCEKNLQLAPQVFD